MNGITFTMTKSRMIDFVEGWVERFNLTPWKEYLDELDNYENILQMDLDDYPIDLRR